MRALASALLLAAVAVVCSKAASAQTPADIVLVNGKVITVDDRFTIAEALAIKGERILAVGTNAEVEKHKGSLTRVVDLNHRTVIPGLIDNHAHYMRAAEYWHREVRLDGITSHREALDLIKHKAAESKAGEWVVVLGGWSEEQFVDDPRGFSKAELDGIAPNNPVALQLFYFRVYASTAALKAMGIEPTTPDPTGIKIEKDDKGQLTGALNGGPAIALLRDKLGEVARDKAVENARLLMLDLNKMGITAFQDQGGTGMKANHIEAFRMAHDSGQMTVRSFYNYYEEPRSVADVENLIVRMAQIKPFQGDDWFDLTGYGETLYFPLHDALLAKAANPSAEALQLWQRLGLALAKNGIHLNVHAITRKHRGLFDGDGSHQQGTADQGAALDILASRSGAGAGPRAHEAARHLRPDPQPSYDPRCADVQGAWRSHLRHAAAAADPGQRHPLGTRLGCDRGDAFEPVYHAVVGGYRQNDRGKAGPAADDFPRRGADRTHTRQCCLSLPGGKPGLACAGQVCRSAGSRPGLPDGAGRRDSGNQTLADHGRRQDGL